jgi:hypothetical protein
MRNIRASLTKLFPRIGKLQENPTVTILRISNDGGHSHPFAVQTHATYDQEFTVKCLFSSQPEIIASNNSVMTQEVLYIYILSGSIPGDVNFTDRLVFQTKRYRPVGIDTVFNYVQIRAVRE